MSGRGLSTWGGATEVFTAHRSEPYARIARSCVERPGLVPEGPPLLVLHAVRRAALQGRAADPWTGDAGAFVRDAQALGDEVEAAVDRGLVQFTEPLRTADLLPGLLLAASRYPGRPLRLVELGCCAGLLLVPDRLRIRYPGATWSPDSAAAVLDCDLAVPPELLEQGLEIADRVGVDRSPVDAADPGAYDWLRSFSWAGDPDREPRLATVLAAVAVDPPPIVRGDAVDLLPDLLADRVGADCATVVVESGLSAYLSNAAARRLGAHLDRAARRGPLLLLTRVPTALGAGLPSSVRLVDVSAGWRRTYADVDLLSERTRWRPLTTAPDPAAATAG